MTIKSLEQYRYIKNEIAMLEARIEKYKAQSDEIVADTVKTYDLTGEHIIAIRGYGTGADEKIKKVQVILDDRKNKLAAKLEEIECFIDEIDDSVLRQIIQLKYIDGFNWLVVARRVYGYPCGDKARKRIERYIK